VIAQTMAAERTAEDRIPFVEERPVALAAIKAVHTLAWFSIESCMIYLLYAGFRKQSDRRAGIAGAVVAGESLIFAANGFRCPLTKMAVEFGAARGGVTDIFLPRWFAHNLPAIHVPLLVLAVGLHLRNIRSSPTVRGAETGQRDGDRRAG
jgi:hypothetical protein